MICYRCGAEAGGENYCPACGTDISMFQKAKRISNAYYNDGLEKANVRNLSGAIVSLKKSLKIYKYNTDARNLLGLVYYEMGEVVDALSEWVISTSYQQDDNRATQYIEEIHSNRSQLELINQTIKKYNQAILYCKQDSRDLAMIQLKKVLSLNPNLVKGRQLLALLYMQEGLYDKAKKELRFASKIDTDNTTTLRYIKEANRKLKEKNNGKKSPKDNMISYKSGNETIIMPKRIRESSLGASLIYIVIGLVVGTAVTAFLIVPGIKDRAEEKAKQKLLEASDTISTNGQTIVGLNETISELETELNISEENAAAVQTQISAYEDLLAAFVTYTEGDAVATGEALDKVDTKYLSKNAKKNYKTLKASIYDEYMEQLYAAGYKSYSNGNWEKAVENLKKVIDNDKDYEDGSAVYYLAQAYRHSGDMDSAKKYYKYVIETYPGTQKAKTSENYVESN